jgi:hypothetical protein
MANSLSKSLLEAMKIIADKSIDELKTDQTVTAIIKKPLDSSLGQYLVTYNSGDFQAYLQSGSTDIYKTGESVYVLIPEGDMTNKKFIVGRVADTTVTTISATNDLNDYNLIGDNVVTINSTLGLRSKYVSDYQCWYSATDSEYSDGSITIDEKNFSNGANYAEALLIRADFKANLYDAQFVGNYGLIVTLEFKDDSAKSGTKLVSYKLDTNKMTGNPLKYYSYNNQYIIGSFDSENYLRVYSVVGFAEGFTNQTIVDSPADIFIDNIELYLLDDLTAIDGNYRLKLSTPLGNNIADINDKDKSIKAQVLYNNSDISDDCTFYWGIKDLNITSVSSNYHGKLGAGYRYLDSTSGNQITIPANILTAYENEIKCVCIYNNDVILKQSTYLYNNSINLLAIITSNGQLTPTLTCTVYEDNIDTTSKYNYIWSKIDEELGEILLNTTTEQLEIEKEKELEEIAASEDGLSSNGRTSAQVLTYYSNRMNQVEGISFESNQITLPLSSTSNYMTINCGIYDAANVYKGSASIKLSTTPEDEIELTSYHIYITNGSQVFQYSESGVSPAAVRNQDPIELLDLEAILYNPDGDVVGSEEIEQQYWLVPTEDTLLTFGTEITNNLIDCEIEGYKKYKSVNTIGFSIEDNYDNSTYNNQLIYVTVLKNGDEYRQSTNFLFTKIGDLGTNGTDTVVKIESDKDSGEDRAAVIVAAGTIKQSLQLTSSLYTNNQLNSGYTTNWSIAGKTSRYLSIDDSGKVTYQSSSTGLYNLIAKAEIDYDNNKYYGYYGVPYITYNSAALYTKYHNLIKIDNRKTLKSILYNNDGTNPTFNESQGIQIKINGDAATYNLIFMNYGGENNNGDNQILMSEEPHTKYDDADDQLAITVTHPGGDDYSAAMIYIVPPENYSGGYMNNNIVVRVISGGSVICSIWIPIIMTLNTYGLASLNSWDGTSLEINEEDNYILAPQIGAGYKDSDNKFTGMVMGTTANIDSTTGKYTNEEVGLKGYSAGQQSFFLDAKTGEATFGVADDSAIDRGQVLIKPKGISSISGWKMGNELFTNNSAESTTSIGLEERNDADSRITDKKRNFIPVDSSGITLSAGTKPYIHVKSAPYDSDALVTTSSVTDMNPGDSLELRIDPNDKSLFSIVQHTTGLGDNYDTNLFYGQHIYGYSDDDAETGRWFNYHRELQNSETLENYGIAKIIYDDSGNTIPYYTDNYVPINNEQNSVQSILHYVPENAENEQIVSDIVSIDKDTGVLSFNTNKYSNAEVKNDVISITENVKVSDFSYSELAAFEINDNTISTTSTTASTFSNNTIVIDPGNELDLFISGDRKITGKSDVVETKYNSSQESFGQSYSGDTILYQRLTRIKFLNNFTENDITLKFLNVSESISSESQLKNCTCRFVIIQSEKSISSTYPTLKETNANIIYASDSFNIEDINNESNFILKYINIKNSTYIDNSNYEKQLGIIFTNYNNSNNTIQITSNYEIQTYQETGKVSDTGITLRSLDNTKEDITLYINGTSSYPLLPVYFPNSFIPQQYINNDSYETHAFSLMKGSDSLLVFGYNKNSKTTAVNVRYTQNNTCSIAIWQPNGSISSVISLTNSGTVSLMTYDGKMNFVGEYTKDIEITADWKVRVFNATEEEITDYLGSEASSYMIENELSDKLKQFLLVDEYIYDQCKNTNGAIIGYPNIIPSYVNNKNLDLLLVDENANTVSRAILTQEEQILEINNINNLNKSNPWYSYTPLQGTLYYEKITSNIGTNTGQTGEDTYSPEKISCSLILKVSSNASDGESSDKIIASDYYLKEEDCITFYTDTLRSDATYKYEGTTYYGCTTKLTWQEYLEKFPNIGLKTITGTFYKWDKDLVTNGLTTTDTFIYYDPNNIFGNFNPNDDDLNETEDENCLIYTNEDGIEYNLRDYIIYALPSESVPPSASNYCYITDQNEFRYADCPVMITLGDYIYDKETYISGYIVYKQPYLWYCRAASTYQCPNGLNSTKIKYGSYRSVKNLYYIKYQNLILGFGGTNNNDHLLTSTTYPNYANFFSLILSDTNYCNLILPVSTTAQSEEDWEYSNNLFGGILYDQTGNKITKGSSYATTGIGLMYDDVPNYSSSDNTNTTSTILANYYTVNANTIYKYNYKYSQSPSIVNLSLNYIFLTTDVINNKTINSAYTKYKQLYTNIGRIGDEDILGIILQYTATENSDYMEFYKEYYQYVRDSDNDSYKTNNYSCYPFMRNINNTSIYVQNIDLSSWDGSNTYIINTIDEDLIQSTETIRVGLDETGSLYTNGILGKKITQSLNSVSSFKNNSYGQVINLDNTPIIKIYQTTDDSKNTYITAGKNDNSALNLVSLNNKINLTTSEDLSSNSLEISKSNGIKLVNASSNLQLYNNKLSIVAASKEENYGAVTIINNNTYYGIQSPRIIHSSYGNSYSLSTPTSNSQYMFRAYTNNSNAYIQLYTGANTSLVLQPDSIKLANTSNRNLTIGNSSISLTNSNNKLQLTSSSALLSTSKASLTLTYGSTYDTAVLQANSNNITIGNNIIFNTPSTVARFEGKGVNVRGGLYIGSTGNDDSRVIYAKSNEEDTAGTLLLFNSLRTMRNLYVGEQGLQTSNVTCSIGGNNLFTKVGTDNDGYNTLQVGNSVPLTGIGGTVITDSSQLSEHRFYNGYMKINGQADIIGPLLIGDPMSNAGYSNITLRNNSRGSDEANKLSTKKYKGVVYDDFYYTGVIELNKDGFLNIGVSHSRASNFSKVQFINLNNIVTHSNNAYFAGKTNVHNKNLYCREDVHIGYAYAPQTSNFDEDAETPTAVQTPGAGIIFLGKSLGTSGNAIKLDYNVLSVLCGFPFIGSWDSDTATLSLTQKSIKNVWTISG